LGIDPRKEFYTRTGRPVLLTPFFMAGAPTPATTASAMALNTAEVLFGGTRGQLVRPGAPVLYGCAAMNVDMKTGAPAYGIADMHRCTLIGGQMARRYRVPLRAETPIAGLYLTGADLVSAGVAGAMVGGVMTSAAILGVRMLGDVMKRA